MDKRSAFRKEICHKGQHIPLDPPIVHMSVYTKGGLHRLFRQIAHPEKVSFPMYEYGQFTDESGHFCPVLGVVMASRYRVRQVISRQGQSAILLLAEDLFCHKKRVVIKVLHASRYQLGAQETHCLWRLALADPEGNSNTVHYLNTFTFDDHYCIVFKPLVPLSLTDIFQDIPAQKVIHSIRKIAVRLLSTLGFLRQQNVIHADLKPENILLRDRNDLSSVTVIDFGNAIQHVHKEIALYYDDFELQTPLYRAPEVMFGMPFGKEIDMWSLGCILAELYLSKPLFMGISKMDIMQQITSLLGPFPGRTFQRGKFYSSFRHFTDTVEQPDATELLLSHLSSRDYLLADFLAGLLRYNPDERMTPFEAAKHSFLAPEFPFGYLLPPSSGDGGVSYSAIHLTEAKYKHRPTVATDIRRSQPSTYDILSLGTALKEEEDESSVEAGETPNTHGRVAKVVPVQRELAKVPGGAGEVTQQQNSARNRGTIDTTRRGLSHSQREMKENVQQHVSPKLIKESALMDKRRVQRDQQEYKYQEEITLPSERRRQGKGYQKHCSVRRRREITEKESAAGHRSRDVNDRYESARLVGRSPTGRCNQVLCEPTGTGETIYHRSPALPRIIKAGGVTDNARRDDNVNDQSTVERKREERSLCDMSSAREEDQSRWFMNDKNGVVREVTRQEPADQAERSRDKEGDQFQTTEDDQLTRGNTFSPLRRPHRGRKVTPYGHLDQATSRNGVRDRRCNKYDLQDKEHPNNDEDKRISRHGSVLSDMNETFVIESDSSSISSTPGRSHNQNKGHRQIPNDQKYEIIRPCPGWFSRKGDGDGNCTYTDNTSEEHISLRCSLYQKPTAVSVLTESRDRAVKRASDTLDNSAINRYVDRLPEVKTDSQDGRCLPEVNTDSHDGRCDHVKRPQRLDVHGKMMKHKENNFFQTSPGYTRRKSLHVPQSPASISLESDSDRPSSYKQCHQKSPRQSAQSARQLASLMNAIREEQDLAEHDLSEKESNRHIKFEVDKITSRDQRDTSSREARFPENHTSMSKMYDSISEDDFQSFEEEKQDDFGTEKDRNMGYDNSDSETNMRQSPAYNNFEKRQDYHEHRSNPAFSSVSSSDANVKEEKYFKTDEILANRIERWKNKHLHESSSVGVFVSGEEDSTDDIYRLSKQRSGKTQSFSSEVHAESAEEIKHVKTKVMCESGSRPRSQTHNADMHDSRHNRAANDACNNVFALDQTDSKEIIRSGITCKNSRKEGETIGSKKQYRKAFNLQDKNTPGKLSDHDILRNECEIPASQKDISDKAIMTESEAGYSTRISTESAVVTRSINKAEAAVPVRDSITTDSHPSSRTHEAELQEPDSCQQVLQSKVQVKKVARKKLNFTQALKPRKSKIKTSKSRLTPVTNQHSSKQVKKLRANGKEEDPYVFLITPEKNVSRHSIGNVVEKSSGCRKSKQKFSSVIFDTRKKGSNACSQMVSEDNSSQYLDKEPTKYHRRKAGVDKKESSQSRQKQTGGIQTTRSNEIQKEVINEEKLLQESVNKSGRKSKNAEFFRTGCQPARMSVMAGEMQQHVIAEKKNGQKQKRKAVNQPRTGMKRQKQSDNWDSDFNGEISSEDVSRLLNRNGIEMQNSSDRFSVRSVDKIDRDYGGCVEDSEGAARSDYGAVEGHYLQTKVTQSGKYRSERARTEDYNCRNKESEESEDTESWQSSVAQYHVHQTGQTESQSVAKSRNHHHKSPKKSHATGHQHTNSVGLDCMGKSITKRCNLVAIGKPRSTTHTQGSTLVNKVTQSKCCSPSKISSAISEDVIQSHHIYVGRLDGDYRHTAITGTLVPVEALHQQNEMCSDSSLEERVGEDGTEFYSSGSEEVMLV